MREQLDIKDLEINRLKEKESLWNKIEEEVDKRNTYIYKLESEVNELKKQKQEEMKKIKYI